MRTRCCWWERDSQGWGRSAANEKLSDVHFEKPSRFCVWAFAWCPNKRCEPSVRRCLLCCSVAATRLIGNKIPRQTAALAPPLPPSRHGRSGRALARLASGAGALNLRTAFTRPRCSIQALAAGTLLREPSRVVSTETAGRATEALPCPSVAVFGKDRSTQLDAAAVDRRCWLGIVDSTTRDRGPVTAASSRSSRVFFFFLFFFFFFSFFFFFFFSFFVETGDRSWNLLGLFRPGLVIQCGLLRSLTGLSD